MDIDTPCLLSKRSPFKGTIPEGNVSGSALHGKVIHHGIRLIANIINRGKSIETERSAAKVLKWLRRYDAWKGANVKAINNEVSRYVNMNPQKIEQATAWWYHRPTVSVRALLNKLEGQTQATRK